MDPKQLTGLRIMNLPRTAGELVEIVYCCRWMSHSISDFARRVGPISEVLEEVYIKPSRRTKRSILNIAFRILS